MRLRPFLDTDFETALSLWKSTPWASVSSADTPEQISRFLARNPDCSWIAEIDGQLVGTVLCGHDCRRGYIYHLVVEESHRQSGIGFALLNQAMGSLRKEGVLKCHAIVLNGNPAAKEFWSKLGWQRQDTSQYSMELEEK